MNYQQRFHTEVKESTPYTRPLRSGKAAPGSMNEQDLFKSNKRPPMFRYLAIKVHEAKLLVDVSIFGKMTTYTKLQIGSTTLWKSSIDKESHMNPKWNEAKTFEIRTLCKYNKNFEKIFTASYFPDLSQHRLPSSLNNFDKENDPAIIFGVYNNSLLRDSLIGEARVSLADILKAKICSNWYMIHSGKEIVGSIHLAFKLEYNQEDLNTNFTQGDLVPSMTKFSPFEHRVHSEVYHRVNTEHLDSHRSPIPTKMNIYDNRNHRSNVSAPRGQQAFSQSYRNQTPSGYKVSADFDHANRMRPDMRVKTMGDHEMGGGFKIHKKPSGGGFQREYETLVTYENNYEEDEENVNEDGESSTPMDERQFYENFFNTRSSEEKKSDIEKEDSDMTDCDLDSEDADEGDRVVKGEEFDEDDDRPAEAMEVQKILEAIKKNNKEVRDKEYELKGKFEHIKVEFGKLIKEKEMFESKKNDLITREECLRNERGNLQSDFNVLKRQEEDLRMHRGELSNLKVELVETKREEEIEKERTGQLEDQIREVSVYLQRETQSLKHLEHDMYKRLIAEKIQDYGVEFEDTQTPRSTVFAESNNHHHENDYEEAHIREVLDKLMHTRLEMEQILTERVQNVGELKRYLEKSNVEEYGY